MQIIVDTLKWAIEHFNIQDDEKFIEISFMLLSILGTVAEISIILYFASKTKVFWWIIFSLVCNIVLRIGKNIGDHYTVYRDCLLASVLLSAIYAFAIILFFPNALERIILAIAIAVFFRKGVLSTL